MLDGFDRGLGAVSRALGFLGAACIGLLAILIVADIVGRQLGIPVRGTVEVAQMAVVAVTFLVLPYAMHRGGHIRSTVVIDRVPVKVRQGLMALGNLVGAVVFALIAHASYGPALQAWRTGAFEGEGALRVPTWPVRWIVLVSAVLMLFECLNSLLRQARADRPVEVTLHE